MQVGNISIATFLQLIRGKILELPISNLFRNLLLEDMDVAISCFNQNSIQCVINSLNTIVIKLNSRLLTTPCLGKFVSPLFHDIQELLQILIEIPIPTPTPVSTCPETENLLINGDFEDSTISLAPWQTVNATPKTSPNAQLFSGAVVADIGTNGSISQTVPGISAGCPYLLSFALNANPAQPGVVTVEFLNASGAVVETFTRQLFTTGSEYNTYVYLLTAPQFATAARITFSKDGGGSDVLVDNVNFGSP